MRVIIYPYKIGSKGAKTLEESLKEKGYYCLRVRPNGKYSPRERDVVINWGNSTLPEWMHKAYDLDAFINLPGSVGLATNKLNSFRALRSYGVATPDFTSSYKEVFNSLSGKPQVEWLARQRLTGHSGEGIIPINGNYSDNTLPDARLYVRYVPRDEEYRVHVGNGEVIDVQKKLRRNHTEQDDVIRNHHTGWVYARKNVVLPSDEIEKQALAAVEALGLHFGAVDVIWTQATQSAHVLEVNTAPGLEGTTLITYTSLVQRYMED